MSAKQGQRNAFTLAEVLITLGIIGVVAALTLPTLLQSYRDKALEAQFKKQYSILQQALLNMQNGESAVPNFKNFGGGFSRVFMKYFQVLVDCKQAACEVMDIEAAEGVYGKLTSKVYRTYNNSSFVNSTLFDDGQFMISDGAFFMFNASVASSRITITVDTNGYKNSPNRWGLDLFTFQLDENTGKLIPMGADGTYYQKRPQLCSLTDSSSTNGVTCGYYALIKPDYFKNLPR